MKTKYLIALVFLILVVALALPFVPMEGPVAKRIALGLDIVATIAAAGGLIGLLIQFKRERDLSEADFVIRLNESFINNERMARIYEKLEASKEDEQREDPFSDADLIDMANYMSFFGPFRALVDRGVVELEMIDILAYRFFLGTNNRFMQEKLLCREGKEPAWRNVYQLHKKWIAYRKDNDLPVWQEEFDLSEASCYDKLTTKGS